MNSLNRAAIGATLAILTIGFQTHAQEKKLQRSELPPAVQKTVDEQSKGATVKGFSTEVEDGKKIYEVQLTVNGHGKDVSIMRRAMFWRSRKKPLWNRCLLTCGMV